MDLTAVLKKALISEKSMVQARQNDYSFEVNIHANKGDIKRAVEKEFGVHVISVSTAVAKGKRKRLGKKRLEVMKTPWKKAIVKLAEGEKIGLFEEGAKDEK